MENEFGDRLIHWENHCSSNDPFTTNETTNRENWYGVSGYPTVEIDGSREVIGAGSCASAASSYRNALNARFNETANLSPVDIQGSMSVSTNDISVSAVFQKLDPVTLTSLRATLLLYEDNITWCCGYGGVSHWDGVTRRIYDQTITLTNVGDQVVVATSFPRDPSWNMSNVHGVAYLQQTTGNTPIIQGARLQLANFLVALDNHYDSVPAGNGTAVYTGLVTNTDATADVITLSPPSGLGSWTSDILVCGDPNPHTTPVQISLPANGSCEFTVRIHTDGSTEVRTGAIVGASQNSGFQVWNSLSAYNGSYSVYLVNDSNSTGGGSGIWTTALSQLGYLYRQWDVNNDHGGLSPSVSDVRGFDIMIWECGYRTSPLPDAADQALMMQFVDGGGSLFFTSQNFLNSLNNIPSTFTQNYLGIASWTLETGYTSLLGVVGDPIGDGLSIALSFQFPSFNKGDNAVPSAAVTGLHGEEGSNALIHNMPNDAKVVFMPAVFNAISPSDPDPNNQRFLLGRILTWLQPAPPAGVDDLPGTVTASRIAAVRPNPFNPRTEILYQVSPRGADGPIRLEIFDMAGRKVAGVFEGRTTPGEHAVVWTGESDLGKPVESGVYFARLTTVDGKQGSKLVLLK